MDELIIISDDDEQISTSKLKLIPFKNMKLSSQSKIITHALPLNSSDSNHTYTHKERINKPRRNRFQHGIELNHEQTQIRIIPRINPKDVRNILITKSVPNNKRITKTRVEKNTYFSRTQVGILEKWRTEIAALKKQDKEFSLFQYLGSICLELNNVYKTEKSAHKYCRQYDVDVWLKANPIDTLVII